MKSEIDRILAFRLLELVEEAKKHQPTPALDQLEAALKDEAPIAFDMVEHDDATWVQCYVDGKRCSRSPSTPWTPTICSEGDRDPTPRLIRAKRTAGGLVAHHGPPTTSSGAEPPGAGVHAATTPGRYHPAGEPNTRPERGPMPS